MAGAAGNEQSPKTGPVISDDDWGMLCIFAEARGEPYDGQVAVGNVIRNRMKRHFFSNGTVVSTVCSPHQFSWMNTGDAQRIRVLAARWDEAPLQTACQAWHESAVRLVVGAATHYHADYVNPWWAKAAGIRFVRRIGRHLFYEDVD